MKSLFSPLPNCERTTFRLLSASGVKITRDTIQKELQEHPDYPSLLSISDFLGKYAIENIALKTTVDELSKLPVPFIAQVNDQATRQRLFTVVRKVVNQTVSYDDPVKKRPLAVSTQSFSDTFTGHVLLADASDAIAETGYQDKRKKEKQATFRNLCFICSIPLLVLISVGIALFTQFAGAGPASAVFMLFSLGGVLVSGLLVLYEVDKHNPILKEVCNMGSKTNCTAVLDSKSAKIAGISWSVIGFSYFSGILFTLLTRGLINSNTLFLLSWINVLALPYILFSIYYQQKIAKQWCVLCLAVQAALLLQFITALAGGFHTFISDGHFAAANIISLVACFLLPFISLHIILPALQKVKEGRQHEVELQRLKHNSQIFDALLLRQTSIVHNPEGLGITIGKKDAKHRITKVCNPYCGPCAKAHPIIEELLHSNTDIQVQIIFATSGDDKDARTAPVKHLLAIASQNNEQTIRKALDDWYNAPEKNYEMFAAKYPINGELGSQNEKIKAMRMWCEATTISFTPTIFVNGHMLPDIYRVSDLKYFLM